MRKIVVGFLLSVVGSLALSSSARASFEGNLTVEIGGLYSTQGKVCLSLFSSSRGFPGDGERALKKQCAKVTEIPMQIQFEKLPAGTYAVVVYHDQNDNNNFDRNDLGMPLEGFGFSQNPEVKTSAPKFGESAFFIAGSQTKIQIELQYMGF